MKKGGANRNGALGPIDCQCPYPLGIDLYDFGPAFPNGFGPAYPLISWIGFKTFSNGLNKNERLHKYF